MPRQGSLIGFVDGQPVFEPFEVRAEARAAELQAQIRQLVDSTIPPEAREALAVLLQETTLLTMAGTLTPSQAGARTSILAALAWVKAAMALGDLQLDRALACQSLEELAVLQVDTSSLYPLPTIKLRDINAAMRA